MGVSQSSLSRLKNFFSPKPKVEKPAPRPSRHRSTLFLATVIILLSTLLGVGTYALLSALWSGDVTGHIANASITGSFTGGLATYSLGTVKPGDSGSFQLTVTNDGDIALDLAEPTTTGLPVYLTVTFTKPPPQPGFPATVNPGSSVTINIAWSFSAAYAGPGDQDFSFTVNAVATQA